MIARVVGRRPTCLDDFLQVLLDAPDMCAQVEELEVKAILHKVRADTSRDRRACASSTYVDLLHLPSDLPDLLLSHRRRLERGQLLLYGLQPIQVGCDLRETTAVKLGTSPAEVQKEEAVLTFPVPSWSSETLASKRPEATLFSCWR